MLMNNQTSWHLYLFFARIHLKIRNYLTFVVFVCRHIYTQRTLHSAIFDLFAMFATCCRENGDSVLLFIPSINTDAIVGFDHSCIHSFPSTNLRFFYLKYSWTIAIVGAFIRQHVQMFVNKTRHEQMTQSIQLFQPITLCQGACQGTAIPCR